MKRFAKLRGDAFYNITSPRFFRAIEFPSSAILVAFYGAARFYNIALAKKRDFYLVARWQETTGLTERNKEIKLERAGKWKDKKKQNLHERLIIGRTNSWKIRVWRIVAFISPPNFIVKNGTFKFVAAKLKQICTSFIVWPRHKPVFILTHRAYLSSDSSFRLIKRKINKEDPCYNSNDSIISPRYSFLLST